MDFLHVFNLKMQGGGVNFQILFIKKKVPALFKLGTCRWVAKPIAPQRCTKNIGHMNCVTMHSNRHGVTNCHKK